MREAVERVTGDVLQALSRDEDVPAAAVSLLLRRYAATGRSDVQDAIGVALARALTRRPLSSEWLQTFVEAAALSDDPRVRDAVNESAATFRRDWPSRAPVADAMRALDSCLAAAHLVEAVDFAAAAVDELERIVGARYHPGEGIVPAGGAQTFDDQVFTESALLTAFSLTARLPYAMLAEELVQCARRRGAPTAADFVARCTYARVLGRLAALHDDDEYRSAAVVAARAGYAADARQLLQELAPESRRLGAAAGIYALAVDELIR